MPEYPVLKDKTVAPASRSDRRLAAARRRSRSRLAPDTTGLRARGASSATRFAARLQSARCTGRSNKLLCHEGRHSQRNMAGGNARGGDAGRGCGAGQGGARGRRSNRRPASRPASRTRPIARRGRRVVPRAEVFKTADDRAAGPRDAGGPGAAAVRAGGDRLRRSARRAAGDPHARRDAARRCSRWS